MPSLPRFLFRGLAAGLSTGIIAGVAASSLLILVIATLGVLTDETSNAIVTLAGPITGFLAGWFALARVRWRIVRWTVALALTLAGAAITAGGESFTLPLILILGAIYGSIAGVLAGMVLGPTLTLLLYVAIWIWMGSIERSDAFVRHTYRVAVVATIVIVLVTIQVVSDADQTERLISFAVLGTYFAVWSVPFSAYLLFPFVTQRYAAEP